MLSTRCNNLSKGTLSSADHRSVKRTLIQQPTVPFSTMDFYEALNDFFGNHWMYEFGHWKSAHIGTSL